MSITTAENPAKPLNGHLRPNSLKEQRTTGVILFTSMGQLLFINTEAQAFTRELQPLSTRENGACLIPEQIHTVVRDLIDRLIRCNHPKDCESIQVERLCFTNDQRFLLRGFCIPDEPLALNSRFLVIMEKLNQQELHCPDTNIQQRYHLTEREQMVIIYLMLGFTREIGLFSPEKVRTLTVVCDTDCELYQMTDEQMYRLYYQNPKLGFFFMRLIVERLLRDVKRGMIEPGTV